ncbi:flagellar hook capping FlgD N-terminal domain-containing protein [Pseudosulfitobacter sp. DSM 107133]|uniref:flagellar hook capping FlgD N-terminal domain-containing protein n=1 Tax=Pseudosulfitobacter sp. DSM 107133 TaxID=2883100 RepID=UPI000DF2E227|nr:flagellar hook capping FlgD N-terminal domain-containing protein [Pseudosulfitobacter sp. DSM 107133]UOA28834.1 Basal-body rod modification protein FlgD [Pseudosulfitobacter sp. DSM 107133]
MTISPVAAQTQLQSNTSSVSDKAASLISSDFETFLQMMTTQARYQDPLEPMDSSEYAAQLAQFSMVEQQVQTNELLRTLGAGGAAHNNVAALSGWIGMEALSPAPAHFDGTPVTIAPNPLSAADSAFLVVYGPDGAEIDRQQIPISPESTQWDGIAGVDGSTFPTGNYTFEIESYDGETLLLAERAQTYGRVTEARIEKGQTVLILKGSLAVLADNVTGLREPV